VKAVARNLVTQLVRTSFSSLPLKEQRVDGWLLEGGAACSSSAKSTWSPPNIARGGDGAATSIAQNSPALYILAMPQRCQVPSICRSHLRSSAS